MFGQHDETPLGSLQHPLHLAAAHEIAMHAVENQTNGMPTRSSRLASFSSSPRPSSRCVLPSAAIFRVYVHAGSKSMRRSPTGAV
ncbi:hypothetical protein [Burkholderia gladioli]|uniref:hypothetical protein n=1 Tax=Burkholderia gladioli TaxID=28095 RepID=UPI001641BC1C